MATQCGEIQLTGTTEDALAAARVSLSRLGWEIDRLEDARIEAHEDPAALSCKTSPSTVLLHLTPVPGEVEVAIECSGPGLALMVAPRLQRQVAALARQLAEAGTASHPL